MVVKIMTYTFYKTINGYAIYKYSEPVVDDLGYGKYNPVYKYFTKLKDTELKFTSVKDAIEWTRRNQLVGVFNGWIN